MCGRFTYMYSWKELHRLYSLSLAPFEVPPNYNAAPTQDAPVVVAEGGGRSLQIFRWGLVPFWAADVKVGNHMINARSEEAATRPAFRAAFKKRRCIVPVSGFYEWQAIPGSKTKQPWYFTPADAPAFSFAGLWEEWSGGKGAPEGTPTLRTFTILTTSPNPVLEPIHNRMPVILSPDSFDRWLDPGNVESASLADLMAPRPPDLVRSAKVSTWVNAPAHNDPRCVEPLPE